VSFPDPSAPDFIPGLVSLPTSGSNDDTLNGGIGNDILTGGCGDDTMSGGAGKDVFADLLSNTSQRAQLGGDIFSDLTSGVDKIDLHDLLVAFNIAPTDAYDRCV